MEIKTLHLNLIKKWFDMIITRQKKEEYREIKPYWCSKLLLYKGEHKTRDWWDEWIDRTLKGNLDLSLALLSNIVCDIITFKDFDSKIIFSNGMTPPVPRFEIELKKIRIGNGLRRWGAEKGKSYFVLELGKIMSSENIKKQ